MPKITIDAADLKNVISTVAAQINPPKSGGNTLKWLKGIGIGTGLLGAGAYMAKETIIDPAVRAHKIKESFSDLTEKVPQLEGKDEQQIKDYFGVIKTFSPRSAGNPLVAGHLINKMIEFGGIDHKIIQDLATIEGGFIKPNLGHAAAEGAAVSLVGFPTRLS